MFATPLKVIQNNGFQPVSEAIKSICAEQSVQLVIVGIPYAIEGGNTPKTEETLAFKKKLEEVLELPVTGWDERYSTTEAVEELIKLGYDWKKRRETQDAIAAAMILKSWLENNQN
jgi:putative holliday junction resolvase